MHRPAQQQQMIPCVVRVPLDYAAAVGWCLHVSRCPATAGWTASTLLTCLTATACHTGSLPNSNGSISVSCKLSSAAELVTLSCDKHGQLPRHSHMFCNFLAAPHSATGSRLQSYQKTFTPNQRRSCCSIALVLLFLFSAMPESLYALPTCTYRVTIRDIRQANLTKVLLRCWPSSRAPPHRPQVRLSLP